MIKTQQKITIKFIHSKRRRDGIDNKINPVPLSPYWQKQFNDMFRKWDRVEKKRKPIEKKCYHCGSWNNLIQDKTEVFVCISCYDKLVG